MIRIYELGISVLGLCLELFSYTVMLSYNYTSGYDFLSYMEYPVLLLQEYALIYYAFKYQDLLGRRTQVVAILYSIVATLIYMKLFPIIILKFLVVSKPVLISPSDWLVGYSCPDNDFGAVQTRSPLSFPIN